VIVFGPILGKHPKSGEHKTLGNTTDHDNKEGKLRENGTANPFKSE
jgi:hypothetical protein